MTEVFLKFSKITKIPLNLKKKTKYAQKSLKITEIPSNLKNVRNTLEGYKMFEILPEG